MRPPTAASRRRPPQPKLSARAIRYPRSMLARTKHAAAPVSGSSGPLPPGGGKGTGGVYGPNRNTHLFDRFAIVLKYWKAVAAVAILVVCGMMYQTYTTIPMFKAQARLHIEEEHTAQT